MASGFFSKISRIAANVSSQVLNFTSLNVRKITWVFSLIISIFPQVHIFVVEVDGCIPVALFKIGAAIHIESLAKAGGQVKQGFHERSSIKSLIIIVLIDGSNSDDAKTIIGSSDRQRQRCWPFRFPVNARPYPLICRILRVFRDHPAVPLLSCSINFSIFAQS